MAGRADANVAGNTVVAWAVKSNPQLELSYLYSTGLVLGAPLRKDFVELRKALEIAIECMKIDGTMAKLHEKWFGIDAGARLCGRHRVSRLRRSRHAGLRPEPRTHRVRLSGLT